MGGLSSAWAQKPADTQVAAPEDPTVQAILDTNPTTPADWARTAKIFADLNRPDLAKQFITKLLQAKLKEPQLVELAQNYGSTMFLEMATQPELQPEAKQLADAVLTAVNRQLRDPKRIEALIGQLADPSPEKQFLAAQGLREARGAAVAPLLAVLADAKREKQHAAARAVLAQLGSDAEGPLLGLLESNDPKLTAEAIRGLALMDARHAVVYLVSPFFLSDDEHTRAVAGAALKRLVGALPTREEAVELLRRRAEDYFDRDRRVRGSLDGQVDIWHWDDQKKELVAETLSADAAARAVAARLAREAYQLASDDAALRQLHLMTALEEAAYTNGLDKPLPADNSAVVEAEKFDVPVLLDLYEAALAKDHVPAAIATVRILGEKGSADTLLHDGNQVTPLVSATRNPDRRLRMAAIEAVLALKPEGPYPGSSQVPEELAFFAASSGSRRALVASPSVATARTLAGRLGSLGYAVDTASTGRELLRLAMSSPDYELALVDVALDQPPVELVLQTLRHDARSADLRVGLIARDEQLDRARKIAKKEPLVMAFPRPHDDDVLRWQVDRLLTLAPAEFVPFDARQRQATAAMDLLVGLSRAEPLSPQLVSLEPVMLAVLFTPKLNLGAIEVLGRLNSPNSQRALVDLASQWTQPIDVRQAAGKAFCENVKQHGILLTGPEITRQYDRYNASGETDAKTQQVLAEILDCIEAGGKAADQTDANAPKQDPAPAGG